MSRASIVLLLFLATSALADDHRLVYSRYKDGRPRLEIVARYLDFDDGEVLLLRYPDRAGAKGKVIDRYDPDGGALGVTLMPLIDRKDIVVEVASKHNRDGRVLRVVHDKLEEIAPAFAGPENTPDLDGDGIPEIVSSGYVGRTQCGVDIASRLLRWNGDEYVLDKRHYVVAARSGESVDFEIPDSPAMPKPKHYVLHLYRLHGAKSARVLIDDEEILPETPIELEDDCHTFNVKVIGTPGAAAWALLEARSK